MGNAPFANRPIYRRTTSPFPNDAGHLFAEVDPEDRREATPAIPLPQRIIDACEGAQQNPSPLGNLREDLIDDHALFSQFCSFFDVKQFSSITELAITTPLSLLHLSARELAILVDYASLLCLKFAVPPQYLHSKGMTSFLSYCCHDLVKEPSKAWCTLGGARQFVPMDIPACGLLLKCVQYMTQLPDFGKEFDSLTLLDLLDNTESYYMEYFEDIINCLGALTRTVMPDTLYIRLGGAIAILKHIQSPDSGARFAASEVLHHCCRIELFPTDEVHRNLSIFLSINAIAVTSSIISTMGVLADLARLKHPYDPHGFFVNVVTAFGYLLAELCGQPEYSDQIISEYVPPVVLYNVVTTIGSFHPSHRPAGSSLIDGDFELCWACVRVLRYSFEVPILMEGVTPSLLLDCLLKANYTLPIGLHTVPIRSEVLQILKLTIHPSVEIADLLYEHPLLKNLQINLDVASDDLTLELIHFFEISLPEDSTRETRRVLRKDVAEMIRDWLCGLVSKEISITRLYIENKSPNCVEAMSNSSREIVHLTLGLLSRLTHVSAVGAEILDRLDVETLGVYLSEAKDPVASAFASDIVYSSPVESEASQLKVEALLAMLSGVRESVFDATLKIQSFYRGAKAREHTSQLNKSRNESRQRMNEVTEELARSAVNSEYKIEQTVLNTFIEDLEYEKQKHSLEYRSTLFNLQKEALEQKIAMEDQHNRYTDLVTQRLFLDIEEMKLTKRYRAAVTIQKVQRGRAARKRVQETKRREQLMKERAEEARQLLDKLVGNGYYGEPNIEDLVIGDSELHDDIFEAHKLSDHPPSPTHVTKVPSEGLGIGSDSLSFAKVPSTPGNDAPPLFQLEPPQPDDDNSAGRPQKTAPEELHQASDAFTQTIPPRTTPSSLIQTVRVPIAPSVNGPVWTPDEANSIVQAKLIWQEAQLKEAEKVANRRRLEWEEEQHSLWIASQRRLELTKTIWVLEESERNERSIISMEEASEWNSAGRVSVQERGSLIELELQRKHQQELAWKRRIELEKMEVEDEKLKRKQAIWEQKQEIARKKETWEQKLQEEMEKKAGKKNQELAFVDDIIRRAEEQAAHADSMHLKDTLQPYSASGAHRNQVHTLVPRSLREVLPIVGRDAVFDKCPPLRFSLKGVTAIDRQQEERVGSALAELFGCPSEGVVVDITYPNKVTFRLKDPPVSAERFLQNSIEDGRLELLLKRYLGHPFPMGSVQIDNVVELLSSKRLSEAERNELQPYNPSDFSAIVLQKAVRRLVEMERAARERISIEASDFVRATRIQFQRGILLITENQATMEILRHTLAVKIQKTYRGHRGRVEVTKRRAKRDELLKAQERQKKMKSAAIKIQALWRRALVRSWAIRRKAAAMYIQLEFRRYLKRNLHRVNAARVIQGAWRGSRKKQMAKDIAQRRKQLAGVQAALRTFLEYKYVLEKIRLRKVQQLHRKEYEDMLRVLQEKEIKRKEEFLAREALKKKQKYNERLEQCATDIQRSWKGYRTRKALNVKQRRAIRIQCWIRCFIAKRKVKTLKVKRAAEEAAKPKKKEQKVKEIMDSIGIEVAPEEKQDTKVEPIPIAREEPAKRVNQQSEKPWRTNSKPLPKKSESPVPPKVEKPKPKKTARDILSDLNAKAAEAEAHGKLGEAADCLLDVHKIMDGKELLDDELRDKFNLVLRIVDLNNRRAMEAIGQNCHGESHKRLTINENLTASKFPVHELNQKRLQYRANTFNAHCCLRKTQGNVREALHYTDKALSIMLQLNLQEELPSCYLNICALYSCLGLHSEALRHAYMAQQIIKQQIGLLEEKHSGFTEESGSGSPNAEIAAVVPGVAILSETGDKSKRDKLGTQLAIAYFDIAVEQEHLQVDDINSYRLAVLTAEDYIGPSHEMTQKFRKALQKAITNQGIQPNSNLSVGVAATAPIDSIYYNKAKTPKQLKPVAARQLPHLPLRSASAQVLASPTYSAVSSTHKGGKPSYGSGSGRNRPLPTLPKDIKERAGIALS